MEEIAEGLIENSKAILGLATQFNNLLLFLPLVFFSVLAFWKENYLLFLFTCVIATMTGFYAPDIISGNYETTPLGITVGLSLILYGIVCAGWSWALIFREDNDREVDTYG